MCWLGALTEHKIMKLNKIERKFLLPFKGWDAECQSGRWFFDGDNLMPVKIGPVARKLIEKGMLEQLYFGTTPRVRLTKLGHTYACKCSWGKRYLIDDDGCTGDQVVCDKCDGLGVLAEPPVHKRSA